ncbi:MAG: pyruvate kinase, partial [Spirochaetota bacterium]|nr:pyruvate kinase [Spirochaetota bacterium]
AILDGTDAIMLSGETAVGKYPVEAVKKMVDIATEIEQTAPILYTRRHGVKEFPGDNVEETLALGVCDTVKALKCHGIFSWTQNGHVISLLSKFHPICPTIAYMSSNHIARRVQLLWGSIPVVIDENPAGDGDWDARIQSYLEANHLGYSGYVIVTETENPVSTDRMNSFRVVNLSRCHC